jgi:nicotinamide phosphoribosyltransferase
LKPFTRDTFSSCIKATYCEIDDKPTPIFKDPKDGGFKKSQKGCCVVTKDYEGNLSFYDQQTWERARLNPNNLLETVFCDGHIVKEQTVAEVRSVLHGGKF